MVYRGMRTSSSVNSCAYILSDHTHPGLRVFSVQCQQACLSGADIDFVKGRFELACMTIIIAFFGTPHPLLGYLNYTLQETICNIFQS